MENIEQLIARYLDGSLNPGESRELLARLEASEENRRRFVELYKIWNTPGRGEFDPETVWNELFGESERALTRSLRPKPRRRMLYTAVAAAAACAAVVFAIFSLADRTPDIARYADKAPRVDMNDSKTVLILSDERSVEVEQARTEVDYAADRIMINSENAVAKEESSAFNQLITPYGKRSTILFSDGSKAWINSGTRLVYPIEFGKERREIYVDGEIYIEVAEDAARPFFVRSSGLNVRVLGTKFNVCAYSSEDVKSVVLVSGSVEAAPDATGKHGRILSPDQIYTVSEGRGEVGAVDARRYIMWKEGLYYLQNTPMEEIVKFLGRYYNRRIVCDGAVSGIKCSGKIDLKEDVGTVLAGLSNTAPVKCSREADGSFHIGSK